MYVKYVHGSDNLYQFFVIPSTLKVEHRKLSNFHINNIIKLEERGNVGI